jgi:hypothetical protein
MESCQQIKRLKDKKKKKRRRRRRKRNTRRRRRRRRKRNTRRRRRRRRLELLPSLFFAIPCTLTYDHSKLGCPNEIIETVR